MGSFSGHMGTDQDESGYRRQFNAAVSVIQSLPKSGMYNLPSSVIINITCNLLSNIKRQSIATENRLVCSEWSADGFETLPGYVRSPGVVVENRSWYLPYPGPLTPW